MDILTLTSFAFAIFVLAVKPGPGMAAAISKTLSGGLRSVLIYRCGTNTTEVMFFALVVFGFSFASHYLLFFSLLIKSMAAAYLIWMGIKGLQRLNVDIRADGEPSEKESAWDNFSSGIAVGLSNPLDILFFAGLLPTLMDVTEISLSEFFVYALVIVIIETGVTLCYALPLSFGRDKLNQSLVRKVNIAANFAIILVGVAIGFSALTAGDLKTVIDF